MLRQTEINSELLNFYQVPNKSIKTTGIKIAKFMELKQHILENKAQRYCFSGEELLKTWEKSKLSDFSQSISVKFIVLYSCHLKNK